MKWLVFLVLFSFLSARSIVNNPPLFGSVVNVPKGDILNVRVKANYRSKRVGYLPNRAFIKVYKCKKVGRSIWCNIGHLAQNDYEGYGAEAPDGWVNAKFLSFSNKGYVVVDGKPSCTYILNCSGSTCDLVQDYKVVGNRLKDIKTIKIARARIVGASRFGAMDKEGDGYCADYALENYKLAKSSNLGAKELAKRVVSWINRDNLNEINIHIHPTRGLLLTHNVNFGSINKHFDKNSFKIFYNSKKRLYWGESYGKGDKIYLSLRDYLKKVVRESRKITKIIKVNPKNFAFPNPKGCIAYEVKWINKNSKTKEYDWLGLVVIMKKFRGKYYIVGLLYNRWTI